MEEREASKSKQFNPLWFIAIILIAILIALAVLISQNSAIKENTKPESQRVAEAEQKIQDQLATAKQKQAKWLKTDVGWFENNILEKKDSNLKIQDYIVPGHSVDEFDPLFVDFISSSFASKTRMKALGNRQYQQTQTLNLEKADFDVSNAGSNYSTYFMPVEIIFKDGKKEKLRFKVVIVHRNGKKYLFPIKNALVK